MEPYQRICGGCRREVGVSEATIENKIYYHDSCYDAMQGKRLKYLQRKCDNGQITAQEMKEFGELELLILKRQEYQIHNKNPEPQKTKIEETIQKRIMPLSTTSWEHPPKTPGKDWMITKPAERERVLRSNQEEDFKRLEAARSERWAWEAMVMIETQLTLSWKEQFQLTAGTA